MEHWTCLLRCPDLANFYTKAQELFHLALNEDIKMNLIDLGQGINLEGARCQVKRSLLWKITGSLAVVGNDLRVKNQLLYSKFKIIIKQTVFNRVHTKNPRLTSSIQC